MNENADQMSAEALVKLDHSGLFEFNQGFGRHEWSRPFRKVNAT